MLKIRNECKHDFEVMHVENIPLSVDEHLYTNIPNVKVKYSCKKCAHQKIDEIHMSGALGKEYKIEDFK